MINNLNNPKSPYDQVNPSEKGILSNHEISSQQGILSNQEYQSSQGISSLQNNSVGQKKSSHKKPSGYKNPRKLPNRFAEEDMTIDVYRGYDRFYTGLQIPNPSYKEESKKSGCTIL